MRFLELAHVLLDHLLTVSWKFGLPWKYRSCHIFGKFIFLSIFNET